MKITDIRVRKIAKEGKLKAVVSITIDDEFVIHDIKVIDGDKGLFIAMPSKKTGDGDYRDIAIRLIQTQEECCRERSLKPITMLLTKKYREYNSILYIR